MHDKSAAIKVAPYEPMPVYVHPHVELTGHSYRMVATIAGKVEDVRFQAIIVVASPSLASLNNAIKSALGDDWMVTTWAVAG